jgi:formamidopyrimidine-DNA glycosylase
MVMMPEGPEVRTLVDQLQGGVGRRLVDLQFLSGRYVRNGKPPTFGDFAHTMTKYDAPGAPRNVDIIQKWSCKGKFIYMLLDKGAAADGMKSDDDDFQRSIWITLGMVRRTH